MVNHPKNKWQMRSRSLHKWLREGERSQEEVDAFVSGFNMGFKYGRKHERHLGNKYIWECRVEKASSKKVK